MCSYSSKKKWTVFFLRVLLWFHSYAFCWIFVYFEILIHCLSVWLSCYFFFSIFFCFQLLVQTRNVDSRRHLGGLPSFVSTVLEKISMFPNIDNAANKVLNQLTVWSFIFYIIIVCKIHLMADVYVSFIVKRGRRG